MSESLEPTGGLGRLVLVAAVLGLFIPAPVFAFPLAVLLVSSRPERRSEVVVALFAGILSIPWLLMPGSLPDQVVRTGVLLSTAAFVLLTRVTALSFTHRALLAVGAAGAAVALLFVTFGWSWDELHWSVLSQRSYEGRLALASLRGKAGAEQIERLFDQTVKFEADHYAALEGLKIMAGLTLATAFYHRIASHPRGPRLGRFRDFRFTEHLGWAAAIPLIIVLLPDLLRVKVAAFNVLVVTGMLYGLRGLAVAAFAAGVVGTGPMATALAVTASVFMLPVALGIGILLGVLDAGVDLRSRLAKPPARN